MKFVYDDGGRKDAGYDGRCGDCVVRAVAIASGRPYAEVYKACAQGMGSQRKSKGATARNGVSTSSKWFKDYMLSLGATWTPTMGIGTGCRVHLHDGEIPQGRLVVRVSKHCCAVVDGVVRDTFDPQREVHCCSPEHGHHIERRCVYGYWVFPTA